MEAVRTQRSYDNAAFSRHEKWRFRMHGQSKNYSVLRDLFRFVRGLGRAYPVPDKRHAANAKAHASQAVQAGRMSKSKKYKIDAKPDKRTNSERMTHFKTYFTSAAATSIRP
jgi:hypothetical protein